jgi:hypothetical protein
MFCMYIILVSIIKVFLTLLNIEKCNWDLRDVNVLNENTSTFGENALSVLLFIIFRKIRLGFLIFLLLF